jgi:hypothetical protein
MKSKNLIHILIGIVCIGLLPRAQAACDSPDPGCPVGNLAEGYLSLASLTSGGAYNTGIGVYSLLSDTTGGFNTGVGAGTLFSNTTALNGTAVGTGALFSSNAANNTAVGSFALFTNTTGELNNAVGANSLLSNVDGSSNNALGESALFSNIHASGNTAVGNSALFFNDSSGLGIGVHNTAVGDLALTSNTDSFNNTAVGSLALMSNDSTAADTANNNTAVGSRALRDNINATSNTAVGSLTLQVNDNTGNGTAFANTGVGFQVLFSNIDGGFNTGIGYQALLNSTGTGDTALGASAGSAVTTANGVICIGSPGADVSNTTWIGNVFGVTTVSGTTAPVIVSDTGQLGTLVSSERFKKDINTMDRASEGILSLRPVTFHYTSDAKGTPQFGLIAEEVAKVNSSLVLPDKEGKPYTVRYEAVNAMLLNEFLKEHRKVEQLERQIEALTAGLQKVSAQLEISKPATQTVLNND